MSQDDLTRLKYIEVSRMKLLNDNGITTIKQLYEMPEEKLAGIKSIGSHYAKLIKTSAAQYYRDNREKPLPEIVSDEEKKIEVINQNLRKKVKKLQNTLDRVNENFKPMGKKKYLPLYVDLKKTSTDLNVRLTRLGQNQENLSGKAKKKIIKRADALTQILKKGGKKLKKKKYILITLEIESFSKMLRDLMK